MKINLIALTTLLVASLTIQAQNNDRVITINGDTIACKIHLSLLSDLKYRTSKNEKAIKITPENLMGYYIADRSVWYRRVFFDRNKTEFMIVVESGKINLYELIVQNQGMEWTQWYASKGTDTAIIIKHPQLFTGNSRQKRKNEFADFLADNKAIYDRYMADNDFGVDKIQNLVHLYNMGEPFK